MNSNERLTVHLSDEKKNKLDLFTINTTKYFLAFLETHEISLSLDEKKSLEKDIKESARGYFMGIKSPHGLETEEENYAADVCEVLEDVLDRHNTYIPDPNRLGDESEACLYGETYVEVSEEVSSLFSDMNDLEALIEAKNLLNCFFISEYGHEEKSDFESFVEIGLAYTELTDKDIPFQVNLNLIEMKLERYFAFKLLDTEDFSELRKFVEEDLEDWLCFDSLISVSSEQEDQALKDWAAFLENDNL